MRGLLAGLFLVSIVGCSDDPSPPRASIPPVGTYTVTPGPAPKPLPSADAVEAGGLPSPVVPQPGPLSAQQQTFVDIYERVGRPRLTVFVNRTLEGQLVPSSLGGGTLPGPGETYLGPRDYDQSFAERVDYDAIQHVLSDQLAANGKVMLVAAALTQAQLAKLQLGMPEMLADLSQSSQTDVLVQVQAKPTQQTPQGLALRLIGEAINTRGGESLARDVVDVPPGSDKAAFEDYSRTLAGKLMSGMTKTWSSPRPPAQNVAPPATQP